VEVRTKSTREFGSPEESITPLKKIHLERAVNHYRQTHDKLPEFWRLDLLAVELHNGQLIRLEIIENAFEEY
jgi:Holliday junction resolvase-like predicted endonuclease